MEMSESYIQLPKEVAQHNFKQSVSAPFCAFILCILGRILLYYVA